MRCCARGVITISGPPNNGKSATAFGMMNEHFKEYGFTKKRQAGGAY
jgi:DNA helicase TIP49 (TBP-interacting protein)